MQGDAFSACLVPIGVFNAAWMELGLLSKSLGKKAHSNEVILDENDDWVDPAHMRVRIPY